MQARWASRDTDALRDAIWSYLTELPSRGARSKRARLAYAFELWIAHLALLEQVLELMPASWRDLDGSELEGLLLLRSARERMQREYRACADCGAPVAYFYEGNPDVWIYVGSLDNPEDWPMTEGAVWGPSDHVYVDEKVPWYEISDGLVQRTSQANALLTAAKAYIDGLRT